MSFYGPLAKALRILYRMIHPRWHADPDTLPVEGAVLIVHHQNMYGPVHLVGLMPLEAHMWSLHCFMNRSACFDQFYRYTFRKRFGWSKAVAYPIAKALSWVVPGVLRSLSCVPVYHQAKDLQTMRTSLAALSRGEHIAICPDIDYASTSPALGEMYTGFLLLGSLYRHNTGKDLPFVPAYVSRHARSITFGAPISLDSALAFDEARVLAEARLRDGVNALGRMAGDITEDGAAPDTSPVMAAVKGEKEPPAPVRAEGETTL